ncbi:MAG: GGDEF domain-containing protein [Rubrivivax sp.]|nr:GGDEF domain-containing protein [Rubrivivax sp.]
MNPAKPPPTSRAAAPAAPAAAPSGHAWARVSLGLAGLLTALGAVLVAALAALGLQWLFGGSSAWVAAAAAALGVVAAALPLGWLIYRVARDSEPEAGRAGTGLAPEVGVTRPLFMDLAEREWARARRYGTGAALLLVDVDRFTPLCQARGAAAGDAVLDELLHQTAPGLRTADVLTRFGDAQMAIFLAHADATGALDVAERIRERTEQLEVPFQAQRLRVTVSVGVAHLRPAHLNLRSLVDDVEDALAAARQAGGNCVRAAPVDAGRSPSPDSWRDDRRARRK